MLEVIACSVADAVEAEKGGADRLEVISGFERDGLTPSIDLVRDVTAAVRIPVRVMLRESESYTVAGEAEAERLCAAARELAKLPVDGLVLGFLRGSEIDVELTGRILCCAPHLKATFHRAFDETGDPLRAVERLKLLRPVDHILNGGGSGEWPRKIARMASIERAARPRIAVLAGGGLDARVIRLICEATSIRHFHVGRAARIPARTDGVVRAARVAELVRIIEAASAEAERS